MREKFRDTKFRAEALTLIDWANKTLIDYHARGYSVTLRQLYYVGVTSNLYPNSEASYTRLGSIINDARMAGMIDWSHIVDRGRVITQNQTWSSLKPALQAACDDFRLDKWKAQPNFIQVVVEKQALEGVIWPVCERYDVPFVASKGYGSQSLMYDMAKRLQSMRDVEGKDIIVIILGDHDPSGMNITDDFGSRIRLMSDGPINVRRIALNYDQVQELDLAPNPAKMSDSRAAAYVAQYGESSWELDSIRPDMLEDMVEQEIRRWMDLGKWETAMRQQDELSEKLQDYIDTALEEDDE